MVTVWYSCCYNLCPEVDLYGTAVRLIHVLRPNVMEQAFVLQHVLRPNGMAQPFA
jgi:hypothetical protein